MTLGLIGCAHATLHHAEPATTGATVGPSLLASSDAIDEYVSDEPFRDTRHRDLLKAAFDLTSLTPAQHGQLEVLLDPRLGIEARARDARRSFLRALADALDSGRTTDAALQPPVDAVVTAFQTDEARSRWGLEALHAVLTPAQRVTLVTDEQARPNAFDVAEPDMMAPLAALWADLGVTPSQSRAMMENRRRLESVAADGDRAAERQEHERVLEAFKGEKFAMDQVAPTTRGSPLRRRLEHVVALVEAAAPVLTSGQRVAAAAALRRADFP